MFCEEPFSALFLGLVSDSSMLVALGMAPEELPAAGRGAEELALVALGLWTSPGVGRASIPASAELERSVDGASVELVAVSLCNSFTDDGRSSEKYS